MVAAIIGGCLILAAGGVAAAAIFRGADGARQQVYQPVHLPGSGGQAGDGGGGQASGGAAGGVAGQATGAATPGNQPNQPNQPNQSNQSNQPNQQSQPHNQGQPHTQAQPSAGTGGTASANKTPPTQPRTLLTEAEAKAIALARVPGATSIRLHLEYDHGRHAYEGEIVHGHREHDFEIDAITGDILEWEEDSLWD
ncbi:MAG: PepSY domain-containing protein [Bifidobacteriaceae bacterium]|nr:PepSY domain-containing protein [Bifidobacteriaceae bacterium]